VFRPAPSLVKENPGDSVKLPSALPGLDILNVGGNLMTVFGINQRGYAGTEAQHDRHHQAAVATLSEAGRQLHNLVSVARPSAVLQLSLLLT
jgi:hypothetical protein